ncbi:MAG TPA: hypothetical protein VHR66_10490 [Gemmataceae bacterium]|jgi:hypothetical protein|nr:hypothetical protein [Gemmataceae bacterium]
MRRDGHGGPPRFNGSSSSLARIPGRRHRLFPGLGVASTRINYLRDFGQFLSFAGSPEDRLDVLTEMRSKHFAAWRDSLLISGLVVARHRPAKRVGRDRYAQWTLSNLFDLLPSMGFEQAGRSDVYPRPLGPEARLADVASREIRDFLGLFAFYSSHRTLTGHRS